MANDKPLHVRLDWHTAFNGAAAHLDEAQRLMSCSYMGTDRWVEEVEAWLASKRSIDKMKL